MAAALGVVEESNTRGVNGVTLASVDVGVVVDVVIAGQQRDLRIDPAEPLEGIRDQFV
ncbi:unannotated protein [freshwater metagenome]|uniref:Unannotated protein n=1 Tax=freshwater metagenome TaxID=449393 RepID=A0A6J6UP56_9ZZZZ